MDKIKTNAMRMLDKAGITYNTYTYDHSDGVIDGVSVAHKIAKHVNTVYKTLVTQGLSKAYYVFVIPVEGDLDLKAAARAVNEKSVEMIKVADINKVTGYIRGGCSPVGMKKEYMTVLDNSCRELSTIILSAGKVGYQLELSPLDLITMINCTVEKVVVENKY